MTKTNMRRALTVLKRVSELYSDAAKWTKRAWGMNIHGESVPAKDKDAVCFCLEGAIENQATGVMQACVGYEALKTFGPHIKKNRDIIGFNDAPKRTIQEIRREVSATIRGLERQLA